MSAEMLRFPGITSVHPVRDLGLTYQLGYTEFSKDWDTRKSSSIDPIINYELMLNGPKFTFTSANALCRTTCDQWLSTPGIPKNVNRITINNEEMLTCWDGINTLYKITPEGRTALLTLRLSSLPGLAAGTPNESNNLSTIRLLVETDSTLVYLVVWSNVDNSSTTFSGRTITTINSTTSIIRINKSSLTGGTLNASSTNNLGFFNQTLIQLRETSDQITFLAVPRRSYHGLSGSRLENGVGLSSHYFTNEFLNIVIFSKSTFDIQKYISPLSFTSGKMFPRGATKPYQNPDGSYSSVLVIPNLIAASTFQIFKFNFTDDTNFSNFPWGSNLVELTVEGTEFNYITSTTYPNIQFNTFDYTYNSNKYIIVFATPYGPLSLPSVTATTYKVVIYKLVGNTLTPVWSESIPDTHYVLLPNSDGTKFVLASETSLFYYKINGESLVKYAPRTFNPPLVRICYDESERLWCSTSQDLFILSESRHSDYMLRVRSPDRVISGPFPVDSSLEVIVYNKNAIQVSVYVTLKAENAIFDESGTDTLLLLTHISQPTSVPIKVTAPGNVKITAVGF